MYSASSSYGRMPLYNPSSSRPASEQSLIAEVSYLHSLWRQGPPSKRKRGEKPPSESSKKTPGESSKKPRVESPIQEKKKKKRKRNKKKKKEEGASGGEIPDGQQKPEESRVPIDENWNPESEWDTENPSINKDWASETIKAEVRPLTEAEQLQFAKLKLQQKAARVFREFLTRDCEDESLPPSSDDDDEEDEELEDGDRANDGNGAVAKELNAQKVFEKMFEEDEELKRFYEQNCNCGAFECLVCAAIGEKVGKRFPDCVSLIQHAMKILRTKNKAGHRGYGRAICCLLGWNVDRLPSVAKPPNSDFQPRACIPPPDEDEFQGQAPEEGDNGKGTDSDGETEASDDNDAKEEIDSDDRREDSDDNDAKEEMDSDGEREASDNNDTKNDQDKEPALA